MQASQHFHLPLYHDLVWEKKISAQEANIKLAYRVKHSQQQRKNVIAVKKRGRDRSLDRGRLKFVAGQGPPFSQVNAGSR